MTLSVTRGLRLCRIAGDTGLVVVRASVGSVDVRGGAAKVPMALRASS